MLLLAHGPAERVARLDLLPERGVQRRTRHPSNSTRRSRAGWTAYLRGACTRTHGATATTTFRYRPAWCTMQHRSARGSARGARAASVARTTRATRAAVAASRAQRTFRACTLHTAPKGHTCTVRAQFAAGDVSESSTAECGVVDRWQQQRDY